MFGTTTTPFSSNSATMSSIAPGAATTIGARAQSECVDLPAPAHAYARASRRPAHSPRSLARRALRTHSVLRDGLDRLDGLLPRFDSEITSRSTKRGQTDRAGDGSDDGAPEVAALLQPAVAVLRRWLGVGLWALRAGSRLRQC